METWCDMPETMARMYPTTPEDYQKDNPTYVSDDAIRRAIAKFMSEFDSSYSKWEDSDTERLIINDDETWISPGTFGADYGTWAVDGPNIIIAMEGEE